MSEKMLDRLERLYRAFVSVPSDEAPLSKRLAQKDYVNAVMDNAPALIAASRALGTLLENNFILLNSGRCYCAWCESNTASSVEGIKHDDNCLLPAALAAWEAVK